MAQHFKGIVNVWKHFPLIIDVRRIDPYHYKIQATISHFSLINGSDR